MHHVLDPSDGLGPGFIMEWLDGEALGARIVRSPDLADVRPKLASNISPSGSIPHAANAPSNAATRSTASEMGATSPA